ncbi:hypothetical protein CEXT_642671 [Caerostris extrusa]|uniref:Uncharacterized protein n=1 Tax=Caerostris extrusa TaxID=172846 RepID=A0AAV4RA23_CAEEX|nr:hypothetical protein CEXT_642671 [Caerostris extrusa]
MGSRLRLSGCCRHVNWFGGWSGYTSIFCCCCLHIEPFCIICHGLMESTLGKNGVILDSNEFISSTTHTRDILICLPPSERASSSVAKIDWQFTYSIRASNYISHQNRARFGENLIFHPNPRRPFIFASMQIAQPSSLPNQLPQQKMVHVSNHLIFPSDIQTPVSFQEAE